MSLLFRYPTIMSVANNSPALTVNSVGAMTNVHNSQEAIIDIKI